MPTVTVVIPTYNRAAVLPRAVESVLEQTHEDLELVVVDDGSDDGTQAMLSGITDPRLRVVAHDTNRGANVARNTGIDHADGEYVAFLDSDDVWHPTKLERQLDRLESASDSTVAVYCDFEHDSPGASGWLASGIARLLATRDPERPVEGGEELAGEILADTLHSGAGSTLLVETEVTEEISGFDTDLDRFQDPEFLLRVVQAGKLVYVDDPLVTRFDTGSPAAETVAEADAYLLEKHADLVEEFEAEGYQIRSAHALVLAKEYLREGSFRQGAAALGRARSPPRHWPGIAWCTIEGVRRRPHYPALVATTLLLSLGIARYRS